MDILVAKLLGMLGLLVLMLAGVLVPVRLLSSDSAVRYRRSLPLLNAFGGGVFLATCFNALLPAVREKVRRNHTRARAENERDGSCGLFHLCCARVHL